MCVFRGQSRTLWLTGAAVMAVLLAACSRESDPTPVPVASAPTATPAPTAIPTSAVASTDSPSSVFSSFFDWTRAFPQTDASPPEDPSDLPGGAHGFSHYVFETVGDQVVTTLVEGPREEQVRVPISYAQLKELYESGRSTDEVRMSREELGTLVKQLDTVRDSTERYRDVDVALADGFIPSSDEVPNMGVHFVSARRSLDGAFDPAAPEILLYVHDEFGEWELVGTAFVLPIPLVSPDHPEAFAGPLDNWHVHYNLCTGPDVASQSATPDECRSDGGIWVPAYGWMIHAWVWVDSPLGVFSMWNTNLPPTGQSSQIRESRSEDGPLSLSVENFGLPTTQIKAGETLNWTNVDGVPHTVTSESKRANEGGFDSGTISPGQSFATRFDQPGDYRYVCTIHPVMTATITVTP